MNLSVCDRDELKAIFHKIRGDTEILAHPLSAEDQTIQTMCDVSPTKWHRAHTSWFFETFLLKPFLHDYEEKNPLYNHLFNSYYDLIGDKWQRAKRGLLSRPTIAQIKDYRHYIDEAMDRLFDQAGDDIWEECQKRITLGIHHEWQHQELLLTDIKYVMADNPLRPALYPKKDEPQSASAQDQAQNQNSQWSSFEGGIITIGHCGEGEAGGFHFDNETPCHKALLPPFQLACRLTTNGDWLEFMQDGGYEQSGLWLSDGWALCQQKKWRMPLYWRYEDNRGFVEYSLSGDRDLNLKSPITHISYYEAQAYARWANKRLPREEELEVASNPLEIKGNIGHMIKNGEARAVHPEPALGYGLSQIYGDGWEWTQSPYSPYQGFQAAKTALGEYNGKFMCNQFVLKGGSCATVKEQIRPSYRNFFPPSARWQFTALRLADDS